MGPTACTQARCISRKQSHEATNGASEDLTLPDTSCVSHWDASGGGQRTPARGQRTHRQAVTSAAWKQGQQPKGRAGGGGIVHFGLPFSRLQLILHPLMQFALIAMHFASIPLLVKSASAVKVQQAARAATTLYT